MLGSRKHVMQVSHRYIKATQQKLHTTANEWGMGEQIFIFFYLYILITRVWPWRGL